MTKGFPPNIGSAAEPLSAGAKTLKPHLMGVVNMTPDSFSDGGTYNNLETALAHCQQLVQQGATYLDIGGESTRPGAQRVPASEEISRVVPLLQALQSQNWFVESGCQLSVDTMNSVTAAAAIGAGAHLINDVSGGLADELMFEVVANSEANYALGHWRGFSTQMDLLTNYQDVAQDVLSELSAQVSKAKAAGISQDRIIVDPGLGFAKDSNQNWQLLSEFETLEQLGLPILVGASRKRFLAGAIDAASPTSVSNQRRDLATAVLTALLNKNNIWGYRVHNVEASLDALKIVEALKLAGN